MKKNRYRISHPKDEAAGKCRENAQKKCAEWCSLFFHADGFGWASINACLTLSALILIYDRYFLFVQGDGFFWALLYASSTAYAFLSVNNCRHY
jgi:hypothetical protein